MVNVVTKYDGLGVGISCVQEFGDLLGDQPSALFQDQRAIQIDLVVHAVFYRLAIVVNLALAGTPALYVPVDVDTHDFVCREDAVLDALLEV